MAGKIRLVAASIVLGGMVVSPTGRAYLNEVFTGAEEVSRDNGPKIANTAQNIGETGRDLAPDGVLITPDTVPADPAASGGLQAAK